MIDTVNDNKTEHRFELEVDGHLAAAYYVRNGNVITFEHTEVPAELGGKGVGSSLIRGALDQVRAAGLKVVDSVRSSKPGSARTRPMPTCCSRHEGARAAMAAPLAGENSHCSHPRFGPGRGFASAAEAL